ncbi:hypothetical protein B0H16DRAFT_1765417 [Mycena metata]|uniref:Uncharacterized protein n=1 Tax=Mycena metata TaxID=1033252 RepID=A0AAD7I4Z2_9AGAR|nr:hypothetical protein B0H16DRAFT_1765417 [Mycena metata]
MTPRTAAPAALQFARTSRARTQTSPNAANANTATTPHARAPPSPRLHATPASVFAPPAAPRPCTHAHRRRRVHTPPPRPRLHPQPPCTLHRRRRVHTPPPRPRLHPQPPLDLARTRTAVAVFARHPRVRVCTPPPRPRLHATLYPTNRTIVAASHSRATPASTHPHLVPYRQPRAFSFRLVAPPASSASSAFGRVWVYQEYMLRRAHPARTPAPDNLHTLMSKEAPAPSAPKRAHAASPRHLQCAHNARTHAQRTQRPHSCTAARTEPIPSAVSPRLPVPPNASLLQIAATQRTRLNVKLARTCRNANPRPPAPGPPALSSPCLASAIRASNPNPYAQGTRSHPARRRRLGRTPRALPVPLSAVHAREGFDLESSSLCLHLAPPPRLSLFAAGSIPDAARMHVSPSAERDGGARDVGGEYSNRERRRAPPAGPPPPPRIFACLIILDPKILLNYVHTRLGPCSALPFPPAGPPPPP